LRQESARQVEGGEIGNLDHFLCVGRCGLEKRDPAPRAGIVDDHAWRPFIPRDAVAYLLNAFGIGKVDRKSHRGAAGSGDRPGNGLQTLLVPGEQQHPRAGPGIALGGRFADAARGACYKDDVLSHRRISLSPPVRRARGS
jgi:hypothetical protein